MIKIKFYNATTNEIINILPLEGWKYKIEENKDFIVVVRLWSDKYLNENLCVELDNAGFDYEIFIEEDSTYEDSIRSLEKLKETIARMSESFRGIDFGVSTAEALKTLSERMKEYGDH